MQIKVLRIGAFKRGLQKNARTLAHFVNQYMDKWFKNQKFKFFRKDYPVYHVSASKVKGLLKNFCGLSYHKHSEINSNKLTPENLKFRETFVRLFLEHGTKHNFKNVLSIDEKAWNAN